MLDEFAWPLAIALAWLAGEAGYRWLNLPRISSYGLAGFFMAGSQGGFLPDPAGSPLALVADFAFALILFELGYRINLRWLRCNPWLGATSLLEAGGTFLAVFLIGRAFELAPLTALLLAALALSTSPAAVLRVTNELRCSGQVSERLVHLTAFNCVLSVLAFKAVVGYGLLAGQGAWLAAVWSGGVVALVSIGLGALFGVTVPALLRGLGGMDRSATIAFAVGALLLTAATHAFRLSPLLAALAFGLVARHRRVILSQAQRNFGTLGDLLTVLLFVFVTASLRWTEVIDGLLLGLAVVGARIAVKTAASTVLARPAGITWKKGALTGLAMTPLSVFAILLLEQTRRVESGLLGEIAGIAAIVLILEVVGPLVTQRALVASGEAGQQGGL